MSAACLRASTDTVALYFYGELSEAEHAAFAQHLAGCPACAAAAADMELIRGALAGRADAGRSPREWDAFMRRLNEAIDAEPAQAPRRPPRAGARATWLALAAALVVGIALGLTWQRRTLAPPDAREASTDSPGGTVALSSAAARHFDRAKLVLLGLTMKDPRQATAADWQYERELAATLLPQTRILRLSASDRGEARLADVLEDLESVLLQASMTAGTDPPDLERIQRVIGRRDLLVRMDLQETPERPAVSDALRGL